MKIGNQLLFPAEKEPCRGESIYPLPVTPVLFGMKVMGSVLKKLPGNCCASRQASLDGDQDLWGLVLMEL